MATSTSSSSTEDDDLFALLQVTQNDSQIIRETLRLYGSLYLGSVLLYALVLRRKYPKLFNIRSWAKGQQCKLAAELEYGWFSWLWEVFKVSDTDLQDQCGMDAVCFLRALRFGRKLTLLGCFNAIWLIPMYRTAEPSNETDYLTDPFVLISVSNLPSESNRFVGTVIASYITYFYAMYLIFEEYKWFTAVKHRFLSKQVPRNYAVYVSGIPPAYRSSRQLENYFRQCSKDSVLEAHMAMETPKLDQMVARRKALVRKLEHAVAQERKTGKTETHRKVHFHLLQRGGGGGMKKVDSVQEFEEELTRLNRSIAKGVAEVMGDTGTMIDPSSFRSRLTRNTGSKDLLRAIQEDVRADQEENAAAHADCVVVHNTTKTTAPCTSQSQNEDEGKVELEPEEDDGWEERPEQAPEDLEEDVFEEGSRADDDDDPTMEGDELFVYGSSNELCQGNDGDDDVERGLKDESSSSARSLHRVVCESMVSGTNSMRESIGKAGTNIAHGSRAARTSLVKTSKIAGRTVVKTSKIAGSAVAKGSRVAGAQAERLIQTAGDKGVETLKRAQYVGNHVITSAGALVPLLLNKSEGNATNAGFVVFTNLYATQTALQMVHHPKPYVMTVIPAANPRDIFWRNVGLPHRAQRSGLLAAVAASAVLCFFWSIPMAFVTSLTEINSLKLSMPKLGAWIDDHPFAEKVLAQLAPMLLLFFNQTILPSVLKHFATWEGHISSALLEASLFVKLGCFMIIQTFFVSAITGGVSAELANIIDDPESLITFLANSLPAQSSFFIQIVLAQTFFLQSLEILRVYPLGVALLRRFFGPRLTAKERSRPWGLLCPLEEPPEFWHAETFAQLILLYMVSFVYGSIAPVTCIFLCFCFVILESGYRYQFIHNYPRPFDTGGRLWKYFIHFTLASMVVAQLTLIGLLALKKSPYAGPAMGPLLAITIMFIMFINAEHSTVSEHLPTRDCILKDSENTAEGPLDMTFVKGVYLQPSLQNEGLEPDYDSSDDGGDNNDDGLATTSDVAMETSVRST